MSVSTVPANIPTDQSAPLDFIALLEAQLQKRLESIHEKEKHIEGLVSDLQHILDHLLQRAIKM